MSTQAQYKAVAKEALELAVSKAPANVAEMILPRLLDEVLEYTDDLTSKLTQLDANDEIGVAMARGIIRDRLIKEIVSKLEESMYDDLDQRLKLFAEKGKKDENSTQERNQSGAEG